MKILTLILALSTYTLYHFGSVAYQHELWTAAVFFGVVTFFCALEVVLPTQE